MRIDKIKIKKLNNRGMTLIEVIASMGILAIVSLAIYNGTALILRGFEIGQFVYESNSVIEKRLETNTVGGTAGQVTFEVNGTPIVVNGLYHTDSETKDDMTISYTLFRP
jgi:prepilin-type N-terminal cleavage/methylation domain-containing protein